MKIHYDPFADPYDDFSWSDAGYCGTYLSDGNSTNDKDLVSCKKCKKKFEQADAEVAIARKQELNDMQGYVDFLKESNKK